MPSHDRPGAFDARRGNSPNDFPGEITAGPRYNATLFEGASDLDQYQADGVSELYGR